jgi:hypothetical protein
MKAPKFKINEYHLTQAKKYGVTIDYSKNKDKKLAIFKNGIKIADIGAVGYYDYQSYKEAESKGLFTKGTAEMKRKAYKKRHAKDNVKETAGFYALNILW